MKKNIFYFFLAAYFILGNNFSYSQLAGNWTSAIRYGGGNSGSFNQPRIIVDRDNNTIVYGGFLRTFDFDNGPDTFLLTNNGPAYIMFVAKYDAAGNFLWAKKFGIGTSSNYIAPYDADVDTSGNIYVVGSFHGWPMDFDPDTAVYNLYGYAGGFIVKINSSGNFVWGNTLCDYYGRVSDIDVDAANKIVIYGNFFQPFDIDPGPGVVNITGSDNPDYVAKFNPNNTLVWAKQLNVPVTDMKTDANRNIFLCGSYNDTLDFDPGPNSTAVVPDTMDGYLVKLNSSGNLVWYSMITGSGEQYAQSIEINSLNQVYVMGAFRGASDFDPSAASYNVQSSDPLKYDIFIERFNQNGSYQWVKFIELKGAISGCCYPLQMTSDADANTIIYGNISGIIDADPGTGVYNLNCTAYSGGTNIISWNQGGGFNWAVDLLCNATQSRIYMKSAAKDHNGKLIIHAEYNVSSPIDIDPGSGTMFIGSPVGNPTELFIANYDITFCDKPFGLANTNITSSSAKLQWNAVTDAISYSVRYRQTGTTTWTNTSATVNSKNLTGLSPATAYEWQVRTKCTSNPNTFSTWAGIKTFTTLVLREGETSRAKNLIAGTIHVSPNPVKDILNLETENFNENFLCRITNLAGQQVYSKAFISDETSGEYAVQLRAIPSGIYILELIAEKEVMRTRFVKQ